MRLAVLTCLLRIALLTALSVSSGLLIEYLRPVGALCDAGSGCAEVRRQVGGLVGAEWTIPLAGVLGVSGVLLGWYNARTLERMKQVAVFTSLGALAAALLLASQPLWLGAICSLCVVVDVAMIVAGITSWLVLREARRAGAPDVAVEPVWLLAGAVAIAAPLAFGRLASPPLPPAIASLGERGKINVVGFTDFECPHCRALHGKLKELLAPYGERARYVRLNAPLPRHAGAMPAALAYTCAGERREPMADALYALESLTVPGIERAGAGVGLSVEALRRCMNDPATQAKVDAEVALLRDLGFSGLPATYVNSERVIGNNPEAIESALRLAASGLSFTVPRWALVALLGVAFLGAAATSLRVASRAAPPTKRAPAPGRAG